MVQSAVSSSVDSELPEDGDSCTLTERSSNALRRSRTLSIDSNDARAFKRIKAVSTTAEIQSSSSNNSESTHEITTSSLDAIPTELLAEIFKFLRPRDLLFISRTCKTFHFWLWSKKSQFLWEEVWENGIPLFECPWDYPEPAWVNLLVGGRLCWVCGEEGANHVDFGARRRYCGKGCIITGLVNEEGVNSMGLSSDWLDALSPTRVTRPGATSIYDFDELWDPRIIRKLLNELKEAESGYEKDGLTPDERKEKQDKLLDSKMSNNYWLEKHVKGAAAWFYDHSWWLGRYYDDYIMHTSHYQGGACVARFCTCSKTWTKDRKA